jgi:hypothetical protein
MAFQIDNCAATPEGIVVWLSWDSGDDPNALSIDDFTVRLGAKKSDPEADLTGWLGGWDAQGHFDLIPGPQAVFAPQDATTLRIENPDSFCVTRVLPAGSLDVFQRRPDAQDFLDRAERIADSAEQIEVHAGAATTDTGRIATSAEQIAGETDRLVAYPLLTSDAAAPGAGTSLLSGAGAMALIDRQVKTLVPNVPRDNDPNRLEAAIIRATEPEVVDGITKYVARKNPYGAADISVGQGLAGAQASSVVFAEAQLQASLPLLDSLESLSVTSDPQVVAADTAILRRTWLDFVNELGRNGGPRVERTDSLANNLDGLAIGGVNPVTNPDPVTNLPVPVNFVDRLGYELGMLRDDPNTGQPVPNRTNLNVVTVDEEKALSDYLALRDLIRGTTAFWRTQRNQIYAPLALGIGLDRLTDLFEVLDTSVSEAGAALDSVFFDEDQRRTQPIGPANDATTVQGLFEWISEFATEEGPDLVAQAGSRGITAVHDRADALLQTVQDFRAYINAGAPAVLRHPRVTNALAEIEAGLQNIHQATQ